MEIKIEVKPSSQEDLDMFWRKALKVGKYETIKLLETHAEKLPCITCFVRVPCCDFDKDRNIVLMRQVCDKTKSWMKERDEISVILLDKIISERISKKWRAYEKS